jgi:aryl-alcohol dehydrogenase-like predicted oxidoreductase
MSSLDIPQSTVAISRLGFGCARTFGGSELRRSAALIEAAIDCGIRHFDTAPAYGSEEVLGEVLGNASGVTITTKVGLPRFTAGPSSARGIFGPLYRRTVRPILGRFPGIKTRLLRVAATRQPNPKPIGKRRIRPEEVLREVDESLRLLRRSKIDLYLLHEPDEIEITDELREAFQSLQHDGVIGAFGLAFGADPSAMTSFGTIEQCRYNGRNPGRECGEAAHIYHGVVRFGLQEHGHRSAGDLISRVLQQHADAAVIFSASSKRQIQQVSHSCNLGVLTP